MEWLVAEIGSILTELGKDSFSGLWGKFKLCRIKKKLQRNLFRNILARYGNEEYYHELDCFLSRHKVIYNIIVNSESTTIYQYRSRTPTIQHYVQLFVETNPRFSKYQSEIYIIIQKYFEEIFNTLNSVNATESVRVISNIAKELAGELSIEIKNVNTAVAEINKKFDNLHIFGNTTLDEMPIFYHEKYFEYLTRLFTTKTNSEYIFRSLYCKDDDENDIDSLDALLKEGKILLLGEAGFGKTYESIALLNKACTSQKAESLLPVYLPLSEYGVIYSNIIEGISFKIDPFCEGNSQELIKSWLSEGKVILILDGIDDIQTNEFRFKFVADTKNIAAQYDHCYLFITSRFNRYHDELGNIKKYYIRCLSHDAIRKQLIGESINVEIPDSYYQLFGNPLFLDVGKIVLKNISHRDLFNRSILFEELVLLLCGRWDERKGISNGRRLSCSDAVDILGQYAFDTFYRPFSRHLEFEEYISRISPSGTNKTALIDSLLSSDLLRVSDGIAFTHKLFKEFLAACHLVSQYPLTDNMSMYLEYVDKEEWKEVLIFASGLLKSIEEQDRYLDFIMQNNLQLYIECINAKSDLSVQLVSQNHLDVAKRYLEQVAKTYIFIVNKYFGPIAFRFDPTPGKIEKNIGEKKIQIVGGLSPNGDHLSYWFNRVLSNEPDVLCVFENQIADKFKIREKQAVLERRNISTYMINLGLSGLRGDSGRKIAIELIKDQIGSIIKKKRLIESDYLLCERVNNFKSKIAELQNVTDTTDMEAVVEKMVQRVKEQSENVGGYNYNGIEMFDLLAILKYFNERNMDYCECSLPIADIHPNNSPCWIWDLYSEKQMANRLSKFFYFHQLSFKEMVEKNFPFLFNKFSRYLDIPYQNVVIIDLKKERKATDWSSEPSLIYYYIASPCDYSIPPQLTYVDGELNRSKLIDNIYRSVRQSYLEKGKTPQHMSWTNAGLSFTITSHSTGENNPLSDYVYKSIQEGLEQVLGNL